eukprot:244639_1
MASEIEEKLLDEEGEEGQIGEVGILIDSECREANSNTSSIDGHDAIAPAAASSVNVDSIPLQASLPGYTVNGNVSEGPMPIHAIPIHQDGSEGQASAICGSPNCNELSTNQCYLCQQHICMRHCDILSPSQVICFYCVSLQMHQQRNQRVVNGRMARRCMRRIAFRVILFVVVMVIASIYSSS